MAIPITIDLIRELDIEGYLKHHLARAKEGVSASAIVDFGSYDSWSDEVERFTGDDLIYAPRYEGSILPRSRWAEAELYRLFPDSSPRRTWLMGAIAGNSVTDWKECADNIGKLQYLQYVINYQEEVESEGEPVGARTILNRQIAMLYYLNGPWFPSTREEANAETAKFGKPDSGMSVYNRYFMGNKTTKSAKERLDSIRDRETPERELRDLQADLIAIQLMPELNAVGQAMAAEYLEQIRDKINF